MQDIAWGLAKRLFLEPSSFRRGTFYGVGGAPGPPPSPSQEKEGRSRPFKSRGAEPCDPQTHWHLLQKKSLMAMGPKGIPAPPSLLLLKTEQNGVNIEGTLSEKKHVVNFSILGLST